MTPNRIVALATGLLGVATVLAGFLANLGTAPQVAALAVGAVGVLTPATLWLVGWQKYEARQGEADQPVGWDDLREQVERVVTALGVASTRGSSDGLEYVATNLVEALRDSSPPVSPVVDPATERQAMRPVDAYVENLHRRTQDLENWARSGAPLPHEYVPPAGDAAMSPAPGQPITDPDGLDAAMDDLAARPADPGVLHVEDPEAMPPAERGAP